MSIQYRINAIMTNGANLKSDSVHIDEIVTEFKEQGYDYDEEATLKLCLEEIRNIFTDLRDKKRDYLTLLINNSEISLMRKSIATLIIEVFGDAGNKFNVPEQWVPLSGIDLQPRKAQTTQQ